MTDLTRSTQRGALLWRGRLDWTNDEDSMEYVDVPFLPVGDGEGCVLSVRNGSPTVSVRLALMNMVKCHPAGVDANELWTLASSGSNTVFQCVGHGLKVGDALECVTAGGTNCTVGTIYYVHGADASTPVPADTLYLSLTRAEGGTLIDATNTTAGTFRIAAEPSEVDEITVPACAAASSTAKEEGFATAFVEGWPLLTGPSRIEGRKSAVTAGDFSVYIEIRRR